MTAVRTLTVSCLHREQGYLVPFIRMSGLWLEEAGFEPGDRIRVEVRYGQLLVSKLNAVDVPVDPGADPSEFRFVRELDESAKQSGAK